MRPPDVDFAAEQIDRALNTGKSVRVYGPAGSGRHSLAGRLEELRGEKVFRLELLDLAEIDAPGVACLQTAALLDPDQRPSPEGSSEGAFEQYARAVVEPLAEKYVALLEIPDSWSRPDDFDDDRRVRSRAVLNGLRAFRQRVEFSTGPSDDFQVVNIRLPQHRILLDKIDTEALGSYAAHVRTLRAALVTNQPLAPIVARLAVGAIAWGLPPPNAATICRNFETHDAARALVRFLVEALTEVEEVRRAVLRFLLLRRPIARAEVPAVLGMPPEHEPLVTDVFGHGDPVIASAGVRAEMLARLTAGNEKDLPVQHARLAEHYRKADGLADPRDVPSVTRMTAWLEKVHHLAHGGVQTAGEWANQTLPDPSLWWDRARALSRAGLYLEAAEVYRRCTRSFPKDDYAWHYLAFNLDEAHATGSVADENEIERAFRKAIEIAEENPWWNGRLVTWTIRERPAAMARAEWAKAIERVDPDGSRSLRSWLPNHLHFWVARQWRGVARSGDARAVLDDLPAELPDGDRVAELRARVREETSKWEKFQEALGTLTGVTPEAAASVQRAWRDLRARFENRLPLPVCDPSSVEDMVVLSWSLPRILVSLHFARDGSWDWYAVAKSTDEAGGREERVTGGVLDDAEAVSWFERLCDDA